MKTFNPVLKHSGLTVLEQSCKSCSLPEGYLSLRDKNFIEINDVLKRSADLTDA